MENKTEILSFVRAVFVLYLCYVVLCCVVFVFVLWLSCVCVRIVFLCLCLCL